MRSEPHNLLKVYRLVTRRGQEPPVDHPDSGIGRQRPAGGPRSHPVGGRPRDAGYRQRRRNLIVIRNLVQDYEHIHTAIGISGNLLFVVGSVLFYKPFEQYHTLAVSLFVVGSVFMLIGSLGSGLRRLWQRREEESSSHT